MVCLPLVITTCSSSCLTYLFTPVTFLPFTLHFFTSLASRYHHCSWLLCVRCYVHHACSIDLHFGNRCASPSFVVVKIVVVCCNHWGSVTQGDLGCKATEWEWRTWYYIMLYWVVESCLQLLYRVAKSRLRPLRQVAESHLWPFVEWPNPVYDLFLCSPSQDLHGLALHDRVEGRLAISFSVGEGLLDSSMVEPSLLVYAIPSRGRGLLLVREGLPTSIKPSSNRPAKGRFAGQPFFYIFISYNFATYFLSGL